MHREWLRERIEEMYIHEMMVPREIAAELDMARKTVDRWVREFGLSKMRPAKFHLEGGSDADGWGNYPRWTYTGTGHRVRVHRLVAIADGADPHKVFSGKWDVDHINGCGLDNRPSNLRLMDKAEHGAKDGKRASVGHTHKEYLEALVQKPPEWAEELSEV